MAGLIEFNKNSIKQSISEVFDYYGYGSSAFDFIGSIGDVSASIGCRVFLIGGFVRDIIIRLAKTNHKAASLFKSAHNKPFDSHFLDLDIVVEGSAEKLARRIKENSNFKISYLNVHKKFGTVLIEFLINDMPLKADFASLRTEVYKKPGALPIVNTEKAMLENDIRRRDFTINTIALSINDDDFLDIKDYAFGLSDILNKKVKVLHERSFIDDSTRMFRIVRFEKRLGFKIECRTLKYMKSALDENVMDGISGKRITAELYLLLKENKPWIYFERLENLGILRGVYDKLEFSEESKVVFKRIYLYFKKNQADKTDKNVIADINIFYLAEILSCLKNGDFDSAIKRLNLGNRIKNRIKKIYLESEELSKSARGGLFKLKLKNSEIYTAFKGFDASSILFYLFKNSGKDGIDLNLKKMIVKYLDELMLIKPAVNGNDVKSVGICEGRLCGKILNEVMLLKIDGKLKSKDDELRYIMKKYSNGK